MPTVLRYGPYRLFFYSADGHEPPQVHIERDANAGRFWLDLVRLADSGGYGAKELRLIEELVTTNRELLLRAWNDYFVG